MVEAKQSAGLFRAPWTERNQKQSKGLGLDIEACLFLVEKKYYSEMIVAQWFHKKVSLSCTLMSKPVSRHLAQQRFIIQKSYQQFRKKSFWMLPLTTNNRQCFPLIKIMCLFSLRAVYFNLCRSDKEHSRCVLHNNTQCCFFTGDHRYMKSDGKKHLNLQMNQTPLYYDAVTWRQVHIHTAEHSNVNFTKNWNVVICFLK